MTEESRSQPSQSLHQEVLVRLGSSPGNDMRFSQSEAKYMMGKTEHLRGTWLNSSAAPRTICQLFDPAAV